MIYVLIALEKQLGENHYMSEEEFKIIRVTMTKDYWLPDYLYKQFENGMQGLWEDWFLRFKGSHAARDGSAIGNSQKYISFEELSLEDLEAECERRKRASMTLQEKIKADMVSAMKAKEIFKRDTLKLVISEMQRQPVKELEDHTVVKIITSMVKSEKENLARRDYAESEYTQLLETYLPKQVSEKDILEWIIDNINFSEFKNKMQAMKPIMAHFGTSTDGNVVKNILSKIETEE